MQGTEELLFNFAVYEITGHRKFMSMMNRTPQSQIPQRTGDRRIRLVLANAQDTAERLQEDRWNTGKENLRGQNLPLHQHQRQATLAPGDPTGRLERGDQQERHCDQEVGTGAGKPREEPEPGPQGKAKRWAPIPEPKGQVRHEIKSRRSKGIKKSNSSVCIYYFI